jgi:hypothetical protein
MTEIFSRLFLTPAVQVKSWVIYGIYGWETDGGTGFSRHSVYTLAVTFAPMLYASLLLVAGTTDKYETAVLCNPLSSHPRKPWQYAASYGTHTKL